MSAVNESAVRIEELVSDLISVFPPRASSDIKVGPRTNAVFSKGLSPTTGVPDIAVLRKSIADWDKEFALPYPDKIVSNSFSEEVISDIPSTVYRVSKFDDLTPTIFLVHGGGFISELPNVFKSLLAHIISRVSCHAVMPHYSLSPEAKAPKAKDEITSLLNSLLSEPERFGITNNIILIGSSSGGGVAWNALLSLLNNPDTRDKARLVSQLILLSPWVDISLGVTKLAKDFGEHQVKDIFLETSSLERMRDFHLPEGVAGIEPEISPVYHVTSSFVLMPPTTVIVGEIDRLIADAVCAAKVINKADVPVELVVLEGQSHNHFSHRDLRDGVFAADVIAKLIKREPYASLKGEDGLGLVVRKPNSSDSDTSWVTVE